MDGIALTTWLLLQLAFDSRPSMNEGLRHSQDGIGFRLFGNLTPTEDLPGLQHALMVVVRSSVKFGTEAASVVGAKVDVRSVLPGHSQIHQLTRLTGTTCSDLSNVFATRHADGMKNPSAARTVAPIAPG